MNNELKYMQRCLELAQFGGGYVAPNPMVGAVLVHDDKIIGEGFHQRYGEPHAEPNAIAAVKQKELIEKCTLYVNLEPCSHFGKTPPCASLIIKHKIKRVVIGSLDPNPKVAGKGVQLLREAGIAVEVGILEDECRILNKRFFIFHEQKRPYILLKWAQTQNGFIDKNRLDISEPPLAISNPITRQLTHQMRSENQAILVGTNTVLLDNPSLTVRNWPGKSPIRVAIDRIGKIPADFHLLDGAIPTLIFTEIEKTNQPHIEFIQIKFDENCLHTILQKIYEKNIHSILVEGGAKLLNYFIQNECWDEANVEISPLTIDEGVLAPVLSASPSSCKLFNEHKWIFYQNKSYKICKYND